MVVAGTADSGECGGTGVCVDTYVSVTLAEQHAAAYQGAQLGCVIYICCVDGSVRPAS